MGSGAITNSSIVQVTLSAGSILARAVLDTTITSATAETTAAAMAADLSQITITSNGQSYTATQIDNYSGGSQLWTSVQASDDKSDDGLKGWEVALIIVFMVLFVVILFGVLYFMCVRGKYQGVEGEANV